MFGFFGPKLPDWAKGSGHDGRSLARLWTALEQHVAAARGMSRRRDRWLDVRTQEGRDASVDVGALAFRISPALEATWPALLEVLLSAEVPSERIIARRRSQAEAFLRAHITRLRAAEKSNTGFDSLFRTRVRPDAVRYPAPLDDLVQIAEPIAPGLVQVLEYALPEAIPFVLKDHAVAGNPREILEIGRANSKHDKVQVGVERYGRSSFVRVRSDDAAASARFAILESLGPLPPQGAFVAVPTERDLFFHAIVDQGALDGLEGLAIEARLAWSDASEGHVSPEVYWLSGSWVRNLQLLWKSIGPEPFTITAHRSELEEALSGVPSVAAPPPRRVAPDELSACRPVFKTKRGTFDAGTAFVLSAPELPYDVGLTCLHVLGPAGGFPMQLTPDLFHLVTNVGLRDRFTSKKLSNDGSMLQVSAAIPHDPRNDLAAFRVFRPHAASVYRLAAKDAEPGDPVFLIGKLAESPPDQQAHPGMVAARGPDGNLVLTFETALSFRGASGAPVVDEAGDVVGMVVAAFGEGGRGPVGLLPASRLRELLRVELPGWNG